MHYFAAVVVPPHTTRAGVEETLRPILDPYDEQREVGQYTNEDGETDWRNPQGKWDWWQVGGRWTGVWSEYDPQLDPENVETCFLCLGSGRRPDADQFEAANPGWIEWCGGCNGCMGKGAKVKWPTDWRDHPGDIVPVSWYLDTPTARVPFAIVIPDGGWHEKETWVWDDEIKDGHFDTIPDGEWSELVRRLLKPCRDAALVVVDYHC